MIRLILILIVAALVAAGVVWVADRQGELVFTLDRWEIHMSAAAAIAFAVLFTVAAVVLARFLTTLIASPGAIGAWFNARRMRRGNDALTQGLLAIAAGDADEAKRQAERARGILGSHPLALLLHAQSALLDGDASAQRRVYRAMLLHEQTQFLGLRGLFLLAGGDRDQTQALAFAERAHTLRPRVAWAAQAVFELQAAHGQWAEARQVLDEGVRFKLVDSSVARRRRAVLLAAEALETDRCGQGEAALDLANNALALDPGIVPAAILAARKLAAAGKAWRAQGVIEACWAASPHPDLAAVYAAIKPEESEEQRVRRLVGLAHLNREHFESRLLEAEEAVLSANWAEARRLLAPLADEHATARVCALMAEIEEGDSGDATAAHGWLSRAGRAPRDAEWRCRHCGNAQSEWSAVCAHCGNFDTLRWSTGAGEPRAETLPTPRPSAPRKIIPVAVGNATVVSLPRPPDDPGPGGIDY